MPESSPLRFTLEFSAPVQRPWLVTPLGPVALETESPTRFGAVVRPDPRAWPAEFRLHFAATDAFGRGIDANPATVPTPLGEGPLPRGAVRTFAGIEAGLDRNHVLGVPAGIVYVPLVIP